MQRIILFISITFFTLTVYGQGVTKIVLEHADNLAFEKAINPEMQRLLGNVVMSHDTATMYCDSAWLNQVSNSVRAFGNVRIKLSDTLNLYGDSLRYDGNTRIAKMKGNVKLEDSTTVLTTDSLTYDRNTNMAMYDFWGKIVNKKNVLVSKYGYYYTVPKEFFFKEDVLLLHPKYTIKSDTMMHNTVTDMTYFYGPSTIVGKEDSIYCENGWYDSRNDVARFRKKGKIFHEDQMLTGDSMYYERNTGFGQVFRNGYLIDTLKHIILTGNYGEIWRHRGFAFMTDSAVAKMADKKDTLNVHGDTLYATFDNDQNIKNILFYYKVKFFRKDLQGACDSLVWHGNDSVMIMYHEPVIWSDSNQLTADTIRLTMKNGEADSLLMSNSAFIISKDDSINYNQIKGRDMVGYFKKNQIYKFRVLGNAETIYFMREEDKSMIGINKAQATDMLIFLENNQIKTITYLEKVTGVIWPEKDVSPNDLRLRGFIWLGEKRPRSVGEIF